MDYLNTSSMRPGMMAPVTGDVMLRQGLVLTSISQRFILSSSMKSRPKSSKQLWRLRGFNLGNADRKATFA